MERLNQLQPGNLETVFRDAYKDESNQQVLAVESPKLSDDVTSTVAGPKGQPTIYEQDLYEIIEQLETDELFHTFLAVDILSQHKVILKIVHKHRLRAIDEESQFRADILRLNKLKHENILPVLRFGRWAENQYFLAFPAVNHLALDRWMDEEPNLDLSTLLAIVGQVCESIGYAHSQEVIHRHLRPQRIYLDATLKVVVSEFGLIYDGRYQGDLIEPLAEHSQFDAPEVIRNLPSKIDERADIYSIGELMKWLLKATQLEPRESQAMEAVAKKCTRQARRSRYQSVNELCMAVAIALGQEYPKSDESPSSNPPPPNPEKNGSADEDSDQKSLEW